MLKIPFRGFWLSTATAHDRPLNDLKIHPELPKESERKSLGNSMGITLRKLGRIGTVCAAYSVAVNC
jgi:hypothetical protein